MAEGTSIDDLKRRLLAKYPRFASQIVDVKVEFKDDLQFKTAATDGKNIYFDPDFFRENSDEILLSVLAHEVMHIKFKHKERLFDKNGQKRNARIWNIVTDGIINANLARDGLVVSGDWVKIDGALNYTAEELYKKLYEQEEDEQKDFEEVDVKIEIEGEVSDDHSAWDEGQSQSSSESEGKEGENSPDGQGQNNGAKSKPREISAGKEMKDGTQEQNDDETGGGKNPDNKTGEQKSNGNADTEEGNENKGEDNLDGEQTGDKNFSENDSGGKVRNASDNVTQDIDEKAEFQENRKQKLSRIKETFEKVTKQHASPGISRGAFDDGSGVVDWKVLLRRELAKEETVWSQRRSIAQNNYAYRLEEYEVDEEPTTEVLLDTSGSISEELLTRFLRELKPLVRNSTLKVACFDSNVYLPFQEIKTTKDVDKFRIKGGGGTNFNIAAAAFSKDPKVNKILFTDGEGQMTLEDRHLANMIWLVYGNVIFSPAMGKVILVSNNSLCNVQRLMLGKDNATLQNDEQKSQHIFLQKSEEDNKQFSFQNGGHLLGNERWKMDGSCLDEMSPER